MLSCLFSVRDCSAGLWLPQTDRWAIRILWRTEPSPIPHSIRMARGWNVRLVSQITLHHTVWWLYFSKPLPARQEWSRVELVALRYSPPKPFHSRLTCLKGFDIDSAPHGPWRTWEAGVTDLWQVDLLSWESCLLWDEVYRLYMKQRLALTVYTHIVLLHQPDSHTLNLTLGHWSGAWAKH